MADIQTGSRRNGRSLRTPRIDLTPMVDLGFLPITFFMYTTTLARPNVLELQMPVLNKSKQPPQIPGESTIVLLPTSGHRIGYYSGLDNPAESLHWCGFEGKTTVRALIAAEQLRVMSLPATFSREAHQLHVIIKPDTAAAYDDLVRTLDEMAIGAVPYYTTMRITPAEQQALKIFYPGGYGK